MSAASLTSGTGLSAPQTEGPASDASPVSEKSPSESTNCQSNMVLNAVQGEPNKAPRAAVACAACRLRKIKCSGDHPVCVTCRRSGQDCTYPPLKRRREPRKPFQQGDGTAESSSMAAKRRDLGQRTIDREWQQFAFNGPPRATYQNNSVVAVQVPPAPSIFTPSNSNNFAFLSGDDTTSSSSFTGLNFINESPDWQGVIGLAGDHAHGSQFDLGTAPVQVNPICLSPPEAGNPATGTSKPDLWASATTPSQSSGGASLGGKPVQSKTKYRVPYFRFFGPTAIAPGYKKVICDVTAPPSPSAEAHAGPGRTTAASGMNADSGSTESYGDLPSAEVLRELLPIFQLHFGYFFPSIRVSVDQSGRLSKDVPHFLLNIMCALAARFSPVYGLGEQPSIGGEVAAASAWATKAKTQVSLNLGFATTDSIAALIMISWYEFGQDRDGGLWMYSGMALRMGQDLGLDTYTERDATTSSHLPDGPGFDQSHLDDQRLQCSLRMMDSILAIGTGRPAMYQPSVTPVPTFPHLLTPTGAAVADPFPYNARIFALVDDMTRILVNRDKSGMKVELEKAQRNLDTFTTSLPAELQFETGSFQMYAALGQGSAFVLLHLWFHTLVILAYQPTLVLHDATKAPATADASREVAASSAKTLLDIVTFAELIDAKAIAQPWINYPMYTAACVFLSQCLLASPSKEPDTQPSLSASSIHMAKAARANFQRIVTILDKLQTFWHGVRYIRSVLLQKSDGVDQLTLYEDENPGMVDLPPELAALWAEVAGGSSSDLVGLSLTGTMDLPYYHDPGSQ